MSKTIITLHIVIVVNEFASSFSANAQKKSSPNILLFHADDMTWRDCEPYGDKDVFTPHISKLAEEGMCFEILQV